MGYVNIKELWYAIENAMYKLEDDKSAINMMHIAKHYGQVHMFVVHGISEAEVVENDLEDRQGLLCGAELESGEDSHINAKVQEVEKEVHEVEEEVQKEVEAEVENEVEEEVNEEVHEEVNMEVEEEVHEVQVEVQMGGDGLSEWSVEVNNQQESNQVEHIEKENESEEEEYSDSEEDGNYVISDRETTGDEWQSDDLLSLNESDDEGCVDESSGDEGGSCGPFGTFVMPNSMADYRWDVGTNFIDKEHFQEAIITYAVHSGRNIRWVKNDKQRVRVKCMGAQGKCEWSASAAYIPLRKTWQLRKVVDRHNCSREFKLKIMSAKWLRKKVEKSLIENPKFKIKDVREKGLRKWNTSISVTMARRAKSLASDQVEGSFKEQFRRIHDYAYEILRCNPGSTVKVKVDEMQVARDANDHMLPLAYAIVEVENKETWKWFLEILVDDLGGPEVCGGMYIYVRSTKGFVACNSGVITWCRATILVMRDIKKENKDAFKYLIAIPPRFWSRSRFTRNAVTDIVVNNMTEAFNSVLVDARSKHVISMLEDIRIYMMKRWQSKRQKLEKMEGQICPKINSKLQEESKKTRYWIPSCAGGKVFEVAHLSVVGDKYVVNLDTQDCSCRKWMITGIPCCHALAAIRFLNLNAEDYIPLCFRKSSFEEMYNSIIYPINGQNMWPTTDFPDVMPPHKRIMPGRPKKKRRLEQWELRKDDITAASPQSQIGLKAWVREEGTLRCTQLLQYEEDDWVRDIAATKLQRSNHEQEKDKEVATSQGEIKALRAIEALKDKAI
ncbi:uncharacterized protein LOC114184334 [Vigna unguiculata]|uniref:uncharacterized protein LOC114184334 n=1 Tax=Vigna unguiculata TaxID=3917 RepID=UPI001016006F|nr:uncharacterized protein LOC114184334 [Vigna unguiculata]